ncbi:hypothetical protein PMZ80_009003 [Knufia obscura]|uniref:RNA polymerase II subunit B1 CTD phosphatase RPAP2 homolog n=2 Tax=Knufia TaxID=430999 RepID=A0AAN8IA17_9EURO|nr:hypothetical protein PMZ80_009003 [Knufia obscura]KAK5955040.1 hypothetical protein OHC33_003719 [Knufia fluminis]
MSAAQRKDEKAVTATKGGKDAETSTPSHDDKAREARIRAVAMQHALSIQEKKDLQGKVLDMILTAYDLPSDATTDPAHPDSTDATTFRNCLRIWRPGDLDELIQERNLDDRCGYALCRRSNLKQKATKIWSKKEGTFVDRPVDERWCSNECKERNDFVRRQLSNEPAWLRQIQIQDIRLLTDPNMDSNLDESPMKSEGEKKVVNQKALALERGDTSSKQIQDIPIREKKSTAEPKPPIFTHQITVSDVLEGMPIRQTGNSRKYD